MAKEATSQVAPEKAPEGQAERTSSETPATPSKKEAPAKADKVNLYDLPEFKEVQRSWQQKLEQSNQSVQQMQQRLNELEDKTAPNDYARLENQLRRAQQERDAILQHNQQLVQERENERQKQQAINEIASEFGVSPNEIATAKDYKEAVKLALKAQRAQANAQQQDQEQAQAERKAANKPDVGGGKVQSSDDRYQKALDDALARKDTVTYTRLIRKGSID